MARPPRIAASNLVYHVLNRANSRLRIFFDDADYAAFEKVLAQAIERHSMRLLSYALMPNHWHLVLWPRHDGDLSRFVGWLSLTHTQRWHAHRHNAGTGHLYQGRFKSFPTQDDHHLSVLCRYVERNPLRSNLVTRAQDWRWSSLGLLTQKPAPTDSHPLPPLTTGPLDRGTQWTSFVNSPRTPAEETDLLTSLSRGRPFGSPPWQLHTAQKLNLTSTLTPRGRPKLPKGS